MAKTIPIELYYEETGRGTPVVLLHGFPFDHPSGGRSSDALRQNYRVITPDLRGHGQSPAPEGRYRMDEHGGGCGRAAGSSCGIDRAVWVGHSMGGYVTMAALRRAPSRIRAAVLVATHPCADPPETPDQDRRKSAEHALTDGSGDVGLRHDARPVFAPRHGG